jgi:CubicO group peptidase (beta-lactamase class C family)
MSLEELARSYFLEGGALYDAAANFSASYPGEEQSYSNIAFGLLGFIVEQVSGQDFNVFCNENIFLPLGMTSTGWFSTEIDLERLAVPYDGETRLKPYAVASYPDGSLKTTVADFSKLLMAIMSGGAYKGQRILETATVREMMPDSPEDNLGWSPDVFGELFVDTDGHRVQGHLGGDPGVNTFAAFNPNDRTGLIVFMNGGQSLISPSPFLVFKMLNYRAPYRRLGIEAGLF